MSNDPNKRDVLVAGVTYWLVQATLHREYTHYICREKHNAERLCDLIKINNPQILPVRVINWTPTEEDLSRGGRGCTFADNSTGPKHTTTKNGERVP